MKTLMISSLNFLGFSIYFMGMLAAITLPIWAYKLIEKQFICKHKALRVSNSIKTNTKRTMGIVASIGTTTTGVFLIQVLPLLFNMISDVGGDFAVDIVYGDHMTDLPPGDAVANFYSLTAELSDILQKAAPVGAVGLGGYNLLRNISRGLPAIISKKV